MAHLAGVEIEVCRVEVVALGKVGDAHAKVAELVDWCWALLEALELIDAAVLLDGLLGVSGWTPETPGPVRAAHVVVLQTREPRVFLRDGSLAVDEMEGKPINRVVERDALAAAGHILHLVHLGWPALGGEYLGRADKVLFCFNLEGGAAKLGLVGRLDGQGERVGAIAAVEGGFADLGCLREAKVLGKLLGGLNVLVLVPNVGDAHQRDLLDRRHGGLCHARCNLLCRYWSGGELFVRVSDNVCRVRAGGLEQWLGAQRAQWAGESLKAARTHGWVPEVRGGYIWSPCSALQLRPALTARGVVPHPAGQ